MLLVFIRLDKAKLLLHVNEEKTRKNVLQLKAVVNSGELFASNVYLQKKTPYCFLECTARRKQETACLPLLVLYLKNLTY